MRVRLGQQITNAAAICLLTLLLTVGSISAQPGPGAMVDKQIDASMRALIVDSVLAGIDTVYVFPDKAEEMGKLVRRKLAKGEYDDITSLAEFTRQLTDDLRSVCHDRHLGVAPASPEQLENPSEEDAEKLAAIYAERHRINNYGFYKVERLPGNIGYLDLRGFVEADIAGETAVAAMKFLGNCDALVVDLRHNGGGSPSMIQLITGYFFEEPTHLNSFYVRQLDTMRQFWTSAYVDGRRMTEQPIYILTSNYTFSGAEEFTYNLKNLERATVIGETTGGGAHPVTGVIYADLGVTLRVPFGRAVNPITETNWEGTGVTPHIECPAEDALTKATLLALDTLSKTVDDPQRAYAIDWQLEGLKAEESMITLPGEKLAEYTGTYGPRRVWLEDGGLHYQRGEDGQPHDLIPMGGDTFMMDDLDFFRIRFERADDGEVVRLTGLYQQGRTDFNDRTN